MSVYRRAKGYCVDFYFAGKRYRNTIADEKLAREIYEKRDVALLEANAVLSVERTLRCRNCGKRIHPRVKRPKYGRCFDVAFCSAGCREEQERNPVHYQKKPPSGRKPDMRQNERWIRNFYRGMFKRSNGRFPKGVLENKLIEFQILKFKIERGISNVS